MELYIKEWADETATLMTEMGHALAYFPSISEALKACEEWYFVNEPERKFEVKFHAHSTCIDYRAARV